jgi:hypothetical protein
VIGVELEDALLLAGLFRQSRLGRRPTCRCGTMQKSWTLQQMVQGVGMSLTEMDSTPRAITEKAGEADEDDCESNCGLKVAVG